MSTGKKLDFKEAPVEVYNAMKQCIIENFGEEASKILEDKRLLLVSAERVELFLVSEEQYKIFVKLKESGRNPYFAGVFSGVLLKSKTLRVRPSLDLFEKIFKKFKRNAVVVSRKAMENILYGRDLLKEGVIKVLKPLGPYPLLVNVELEVIGLGRLVKPYSEWSHVNSKDVVVETIMDKGWYLRSGG